VATSDSNPRLPWQARQPSYIVKLLAVFGFLLLAFFGVGAVIVALMMTYSYTVNGPGPGETWLSAAPWLFGTVIVGALLLFGAVKLYPIVAAPTSFKPSYGAVPTDVAGHPFEVRYKRQFWGRTLAGKGAVRFAPEGLVLEGHLSTHTLVQLAIVFLVTILPLVLFGVGLGFIPAILLAYYIGRKRIAQPVPYGDVCAVALRDCHLAFELPRDAPKRVELDVAIADSERFYRELQTRFPAVVTAAFAGSR
jgi:hypothetical protein